MFLNLSNHPSGQWCAEQIAAAKAYGEITDMPFPAVPPEWDAERVSAFADRLFAQIVATGPAAVLCQGEMTLTYQLVKRLTKAGVPALCACSDRLTEETTLPDGSTKKISRFVFRGFRLYDAAGNGE